MSQFLLDNLLLIGCIIVSAGGLIFSSLNQKRYGLMLSPADATTLINRKNAQVLDVRKAADFKKGHIAGSINAPADQIQSLLGQLDKTRPVLVVDNTGSVARGVAKLLRSIGFTEVCLLEGGLAEWQKNNMPLTK